jgi:quercetin dioxygenase-like cupin family protein
MNKTALIAFCLVLALTLRADDRPAYSSDVKVTRLLQTSTTATGQPIVYPKGTAEVSILRVEIPPGAQTDWHKHPVPIFGLVESGVLTVNFIDGTKKTLRAGDAMAEAVNVMHNGVNEGKEPVKLLIFVAGEKNVPFTVTLIQEALHKSSPAKSE